jgi:hypothetical protein
MIVRTFVTLLYLVVVVVAILIQFVFPILAFYVLVGLLAWFILSLFVYRLPVMSRPIGRTRPAPAAAAGFGAPNVAAPLPAGPSAGPSAPLDFCPYCAAPVAPGTPVCPECHHRIPVF